MHNSSDGYHAGFWPNFWPNNDQNYNGSFQHHFGYWSNGCSRSGPGHTGDDGKWCYQGISEWAWQF